ncbi:ribosomal protein S18-alanine N-acetyltransferase [Stappia indica]|uniref:ribosomal protein S18-alanine N-acetyltransferase n=1 Tax=Stappia indica TaxID=538381 RepID=UPI001CD1F165|nr:ribosomal protein S18-alanine N-acetyltransferase [Stappia indica]MCA1300502.1 ribosomal protein S18-alanine N-acetyltransferase [Stappia indica]
MTFWWFWAPPPVVEEATAEDLDQLAEIHARSFDGVWSSEELAALRAQTGVVILLARRANAFGSRNPLGFVILRSVADEAEILTLAVDPRQRGRGIGVQLMRAAMRRLYAERTKMLFLEVDEANEPALRLYRGLGFRKVGERRGYYQTGDGGGGALVMRADLA